VDEEYRSLSLAAYRNAKNNLLNMWKFFWKQTLGYLLSWEE
jgi:hypothetical protein